MRKVYLDYAATTPVDQRVFEAMKPYFTEKFGNASSIHKFGQETRSALDESRDTIAKLLGAKQGEIIFSSGGTEADNFAMKGAAWQMLKEQKLNHIITSKVEHHAVLESCRFLQDNGFNVSYIDVGETGIVSPDDIRTAITPQTGLISIIHANNEIGTINPISEIAKIAQEHQIIFHTDAVQALGKLDLNLNELHVDLAAFSAHKIYGPKGIGALYLRKGTGIENFIHGGGQEQGHRAGTENVPFVVGFAKAVELICLDRELENSRLLKLKTKLCSMLEERFQHIIFNGHSTESLPNILSISFNSKKIEIDGEALLFNLDLAGVAVANGSACTSGSMKPSHVLLALGRDSQTAMSTIRFSLGKSTSEEDIDYTVEVLEKIVRRIGKEK
jgi:cysteine desulfurase